jgi:hypothetical protein
MPRISKNISINNSSEIISNAESDPESSSSASNSYGTGDEGSSDSRTNVSTNSPPSESDLKPSFVRLSILVVCPITALAHAVSLIWAGIELNKTNLPDEYRTGIGALFAANSVMICAALLSTKFAYVKRPNPTNQAATA